MVLLSPQHSVSHAEITQLVECLPSKQNVAGSSPVFRSTERVVSSPLTIGTPLSW